MLFLKPLSRTWAGVKWEKSITLTVTLVFKVACIYFMVTHFHCIIVCNVNTSYCLVSCESVEINIDFHVAETNRRHSLSSVSERAVQLWCSNINWNLVYSPFIKTWTCAASWRSHEYWFSPFVSLKLCFTVHEPSYFCQNWGILCQFTAPGYHNKSSSWSILIPLEWNPQCAL